MFHKCELLPQLRVKVSQTCALKAVQAKNSILEGDHFTQSLSTTQSEQAEKSRLHRRPH